MRIGLHYGLHFKIKGLDQFSTFELLTFLSIILLRGGDIETNPGPDFEVSFSSSSSNMSKNESILQNKFSLVHYNVQSLMSKKDILFSELHHFDVISITETWLDNRTSDQDAELPGYNTYRRDRIGDNHGGICVYVNNNIFSKRRNDLELRDVECIWVEILTHNKKVLIGTFYRPPNSHSMTLTSIENSVGLAIDTNIENILITGDFNLDMRTDRSSRKISDICQQYSLSQIISEPTHFTETSSSLIDLILTTNTRHVLLSGVGDPFLDQSVRYHCPVYCVLNFNKVKSNSYTRPIWLYDRGNYQSMNIEIANKDWDSIKHADINIYAKNLTEYLSQVAKNHIPNKTIKINQSDPSWLSSNIKKLMRKRKRLYDKYRKTKRISDFEKYKQIRNKINNEIRRAKQNETRKLADRLQDNTLTAKDWWRTLKPLIKPSENSSIPPLMKNNKLYSDNISKAEILNGQFCEQTKLNDDNVSLPNSNFDHINSLESITISRPEVECTLKSLATGKAAGPDGVNNRLLKELSHTLSSPLCDLFNYSLSSGTFPDVWKQANVTPIYKGNDASDPSNYRPISLLSSIGKVLEKIVHKHLFNFFHDNNVLTTLQSGFVPGDSTVNQLVDLYNTFCKALDDGKEVRAIFCDISKAFDRVWHRGLIFKLKSVGIDGRLLSWLTDYLDNRTQRVVLPGATSNWKNINAGVPQGSILGPLLFLIYINDIVENINSKIRLFADDTSLYLVVDNPVTSAEQLNSDMSKIKEWASKWLVTFNPSKTESLVFSRKHYKPVHPPIIFDNQIINEVNSHKHLGLTFSTDCTWHNHLIQLKTKAWYRINIMRKLKYVLDRQSLQTIYFTFIRPLLEYADVVWDNCTQYEANELEKIQIEAARIVTGTTKLVSHSLLYSETGWEALSSRRNKHKLTLFYKMSANLSPAYLSSLLPSTTGANVQYNLRNAANIQTVHANSQLYFNSFLPSTIRCWNELPLETRSASSVASFKQTLNSNLIIPPSYFYIGNRADQIQHARLRTKCSSLKQHLFLKNIIDSPLCICGKIEDTEHFLFDCRLYHGIRQEMTRSLLRICRPSVNILLYGDTNLSYDDNRQIFKIVHEFITKSKRFRKT